MKAGSRSRPASQSSKQTQPSIQTQKLFEQGIALHQSGQLLQAKALYAQVLRLAPKHFDALHLLGVIAYQQHEAALALALIDRAIGLLPQHPSAHSNRGNALRLLNRLEEALQSYDRAIELRPDFAEAMNNRGLVLNQLKRRELALQSYDQALAINPGFADAHNNRGLVLQDMKEHAKAISSFGDAIAIKPLEAAFYFNCGNVLHEIGQYAAAVMHYEQAIQLNAAYAQAMNNLGLTLQQLQQQEKALQCYQKAATIQPDYADAIHNAGSLLLGGKQYVAAIDQLVKAFALQPTTPFLQGTLQHSRMNVCDWAGFDAMQKLLVQGLAHQETVSPPFVTLGLSSSGQAQHNASKIWVRSKLASPLVLPPITPYSAHERIKIGYFSADFHDHATAYLMAELFELHDKTRFELIAFSFGPDKLDTMRQRLLKSFDQFFDVRLNTDLQVTQLARQLEIDISIDLKGYTTDSRAPIFALRAAPVQVNYLGYPGTMGADFMDYLVADHTLIPPQSRVHYTEKIAYLPHSYQVNDAKRQISDRVFTREEVGLPPTGFVFCCFNNNYKITPDTFDGWMRILQAVPDSVLWLLADNPTAAQNLSKEAELRGVSAKRLVFAPRLGLAEHLARHRLADLFIDTLPCNAHTTASDALWVGLPVLTCMGEAFASRVAASLLQAVGLPELITESQPAYETLAIELASHPAQLAAIKLKLERNRLTTPLFDTASYAKHLEALYAQMHECSQKGLPVEHLNAA
jgi:predicted O-linked N-acetylglucosamine transferase (SPINDLY family)